MKILVDEKEYEVTRLTGTNVYFTKEKNRVIFYKFAENFIEIERYKESAHNKVIMKHRFIMTDNDVFNYLEKC